MEASQIFVRLGLALGLGLLVGLQREYAAKTLAGIRTFPLITLAGAFSALLALELGGWIVAAGMIGLCILVVGVNMLDRHAGRVESGMTTEAAVLLMYGVGAYLIVGRPIVAVAAAAVTAALLQFKQPLHDLVRRIGEADIKAIMQFALISLVILPVLPNRNMGPGPYQVLNPYKIWLLVVLIVGMSLAGYVALKILGPRVGAMLGGLLGGIVSSTATTVSFCRQAKNQPDHLAAAVIAIAIASAVVFFRVLVLIAVVAPTSFKTMAPPLAGMGAFMAILAVIALALMHHRGPITSQAAAPTNPSELKSALVFGGLFALILLLVAIARDYLGASGLYVVGAISGLTDMDAITMSTAQMTSNAENPLSASLAWRVVLVGALANVVFKTGIVAVMGNRALLMRMSGLFGVALLAGLAILWLWPG